MKKMVGLILTVIAVLSGCASYSEPEEESLVFTGVASVFSVLEYPALAGRRVCENSYVLKDGNVYAFYDKHFSGNLTVAEIGQNMTGSSAGKVLMNEGARFSYVFATDNGYAMLVTRDNDIYISESKDLVSWDSFSVLLAHSDDPKNRRFIQWNAAICYDGNGDAHILVEASDNTANQADVRLVHLVRKAGSSEFIEVGSDIMQGGNAWMQYIPGKGILAVFGMTTNNGFWETRAAILPDGETEWIVASRDKFCIGEANIHVCDPHLVEFNGKTLFCASYDQKELVSFVSNVSLSDLYGMLE